MSRVVITGMGVVSPVGNNVNTFWNALISGVSGVRKIDTFDVSESKSKIAGLVRDFEPPSQLGRDIRRMDRFCQFALTAAMEAVSDASLNLAEEDRDRVGVYLGSGIGGLQTLLENHNILRDRGPRRVSPSLVPMMIPNMAAAQVSIHFHITGPCIAPVTACATGNNAIGEAFHALRSNKLNVVIAGGTEAAINELTLSAFGNATALSTLNDHPQRASRPFDAERDGFVVAEGAGVLVLENLEHALKRGAHIYAEIIGYGTSSDAYHIVAPDPEGKGASRAMKEALHDAGICAAKVDHINAHATSTIGDVVETRAIKNVFGQHVNRLSITANKSMMGHTLGAAGGIEAIALAKTIHEGIIPPTINLEHPDKECDLDYVPGYARHQEVRIGMSNSFGFGGHNAVLVFKRF